MRSKYSGKSTYLRATLALVSIIFLVLAAFPGLLMAAEPLSDTGQTNFHNKSSEIIQPAPGAAFYGQGAQFSASERQHSYTKLDTNGNALPVSATNWYQVKDNGTSLIWEVKTDDGSIHDRDNIYTWSNAQSVFITELNSDLGCCGKKNWRLPTIKELSGLAPINMGHYVRPRINVTYSPQTMWAYYWSSTTMTNNTKGALLFHFYHGYDNSDEKLLSYCVRAVRSGQ